MKQSFRYVPRAVPLTAHRSPFVYKPRTAEDLQARIDQDGEPQPVAPVPVHQGKVTNATLCACGHRRDRHCLRFGWFHWPAAGGPNGFFSCLYEHCGGTRRGVPCPCAGFRLQADDPIKPKAPRADDYTPCVTCGHWRAHHCTVRRKEPAQPWEYAGFEYLSESHPFICKHFTPDAPYRCTSSACALDDCACQKFVSPHARKKQPAAPKAPRQPRKRKAAQPDAQLFLFSDGCEDQPHV